MGRKENNYDITRKNEVNLPSTSKSNGFYEFIDKDGSKISGFDLDNLSFRLTEYPDGRTKVEQHNNDYDSKTIYQPSKFESRTTTTYLLDDFSLESDIADFEKDMKYLQKTARKGCLGCLFDIIIFIVI